jgi:hypothetical protein
MIVNIIKKNIIILFKKKTKTRLNDLEWNNSLNIIKKNYVNGRMKKKTFSLNVLYNYY